MNRNDFRANWHTHNFRCRHARGDFADYAQAALDKVPAEDQPRLALEYGDFVAEMIESGFYAFIAHPDLIGCFCDGWLPECEQATRKIAATAESPLKSTRRATTSP